MPRSILAILLIPFVNLGAFEIIAHRGYACNSIQNTIDAVEDAWALGVHAVELDVQVSRDNIAYVFHDTRIQDKRVSRLNYSEIQGLARGQVAPMLVDILRHGQASGYYILDLKSSGARQYLDVVDAVNKSGFSISRVVFQSDSPTVLSEIKSRLPRSQNLYLTRLKRQFPFFFAPDATDVLRRVGQNTIDGVSFKGRSFVDRQFVAELKEHGYRVNVWTVNDSASAAHYADIGVDGIITDEPEKLANMIKGPTDAIECSVDAAGRR